MNFTNFFLRATVAATVCTLFFGTPLLYAQGLSFADFVVSEDTIPCRTTITFTSLSVNAEEFSWTFDGGAPQTSTEPNPTVTYFGTGAFDVTLQINGESGSDAEFKEDFIVVETCSQAPFQDLPTSIPGRLEAERYDYGGQGISYADSTEGNAAGAFRTDDVDIGWSPLGGYTVGYIEAGEWLEFTINAEISADYDFSIITGTPEDSAVVEISLDGNVVIPSYVIPVTGDYAAYTDSIFKGIAITEGEHVLRISFWGDPMNIDFVDISDPLNRTQVPFSGNPILLPGTLQVENYDLGGPGIAYFDTDETNNGGQYRNDQVDVGFDKDSVGFAVGWIEVGEWLEYQVDLTSGTYDISLTTATPQNNVAIAFLIDGDTLVQGDITPSGSWDIYTTTIWKEVLFPSGTVTLRMAFLSGALNVDSVVVGSAVVVEQAPYLGTPHAIPGIIESEDYDLGGPGIAYNDNSPGNTGGEYRDDDVDLGSDGFGGAAIGWSAAGEWQEYTVNVVGNGTYNLLASGGTIGDSVFFHIEFDGEDMTGPIKVPDTGDWGIYDVFNVGEIQLKAGEQVMRVVMDNDGVNLDKLAFSIVTEMDSPRLTDIVVYPTSTSERTLHISHASHTPQIRLLSTTGHVISTRLNTSHSTSTMDASGVASGTYFVEVKTQNGRQTFPVFLR